MTVISPASKASTCNTRRTLWGLLALVSLSVGVTACAPVVLGTAAVGSVLVATDRRTSGIQLEDEGIELRANARLREALGDKHHINVTSYNRQVLLTGEVAAAADRQRAEQVVARVENVRSVVNELVATPNSSLSQRSNDAIITGKVKASMVDAKDMQANAFKVVTERAVVYLMGRVTQREANRATEVARGVSGVSKVVRVFEYITEDELKGLQPQAPRQ